MGVDLRLVDCAPHGRAATQPGKNNVKSNFLSFIVRSSVFALLSAALFQTGPPSGTDRVKKGGSYMCHKVKMVNVSAALCKLFSIDLKKYILR